MMMVMMCLQTLPPHKMADIGITLSITKKRPSSRKEGKRRKKMANG
jgi:hypothetical protein